MGAKRSEEYDQWWTEMEREGAGVKPGGLKQTLARRRKLLS